LLKKTSLILALCGLAVLAASASPAAENVASRTAPKPDTTTTASVTNAPKGQKNELPGNGPSADDPKNRTLGIAAVVNDSIITDYELRQRTALMGATTGVRADNDEQRKALRAQVLRQLETEKMEVLEANRKNITISSEDVDKAVQNILQENNLTIDKLTEVLGHNGVHLTTLRSQIATQLAWQRAVEDEFSDQVRLKPSEIDQEFARVKAGAAKVHYQVAEIFLGVDNPEQEEKIKANADQIHDQLQKGAPFNSLARQVSQSPSAAQGGDLGMVEDGQLAPELNTALGTLKVGDITKPLRSVGGYYILFLRRRFEPAGTKVQVDTTPKPVTNATPLAQVLIPIGPKPPKALLDQAVSAATQISEHYETCADLQQLVSKTKGIRYFDLPSIGLHYNDLDPQIQEALKNSEPGGSTVPLVNGNGVNLVVRCDARRKKPPEVWPMPTRDEVESQLLQERISTLARGYLARLRRGADVQDR